MSSFNGRVPKFSSSRIRSFNIPSRISSNNSPIYFGTIVICTLGMFFSNEQLIIKLIFEKFLYKFNMISNSQIIIINDFKRILKSTVRCSTKITFIFGVQLSNKVVNIYCSKKLIKKNDDNKINTYCCYYFYCDIIVVLGW